MKLRAAAELHQENTTSWSAPEYDFGEQNVLRI